MSNPIANAIEGAQVQSSDSDQAKINTLALLDDLAYAKQRREEAQNLGITVSELDKLVKQARSDSVFQPKNAPFEKVILWHEPVQGDALLHEIAQSIQRFIVCPEETVHAATLWACMTWLMDVVQVAPLTVITAPEKRCGKSQFLFLLGKLVHRPLAASSISPAALFRSIDVWQPTLLIDEADAFMRDNEELRGLLNAGHTRDSAYVIRTVGENHEPTQFNVWGAKAIAGIGKIADTLMDRSITLELRRKLPHEQVERLRYAEPGLFEALRSKLARWAQDNAEAIRNTRPHLPEWLNDRAQDNWEPLLAIAEIAGGFWPDLALQAAKKLSAETDDAHSVSSELLADIKNVFEQKSVDRISSTDLIRALCDDEELGWATYNRGKPITPRQLAKRLKEYNIVSGTIRLFAATAKGYKLEQFEDAFDRYLYICSASTPAPSVTTSHPA